MTVFISQVFGLVIYALDFSFSLWGNVSFMKNFQQVLQQGMKSYFIQETETNLKPWTYLVCIPLHYVHN